MSTLRTAREIAWEQVRKTTRQDDGLLDIGKHDHEVLEIILVDTIIDDRADIARVLCEALEEKKLKYTPNFQQTEPYVGGYNQASLDAITLIKTTLSTTKTEV